MTTTLLIVLGVVVWLSLVTLAIALCAAAGRADRHRAQERSRPPRPSASDRRARFGVRRMPTRGRV